MIRLNHICKRFDDKVLFDDFSLELPEHGTVCFSAPSGFGKTTLFRMILGLDRPDSGEITGTENLRFSCAFQEPRLVPGLSALQNVLLVSQDPDAVKNAAGKPGKETETIARAKALLADFGLENEADHLPAALSGGEARRVSLARALFADFDVLILDEPFSGIDEARKKQIIPAVKAASQDRLVLVTTHFAEEAEMLGAKTVDLA